MTLEEIRGAAERIRGVVRRTPLLPVDAEASRAPVRLKCENLQRGGAFKLRGAYNFIACTPEERRGRGVITYSSGNHGRAVAQAAAELGVSAVVVVPVDIPRIKEEGIRDLGAVIVKEGTTSVERQRRALAIAEERGLEVVPPFDHRDIIAGQGTVGLEIVEDWPDVGRVIAPIGGGGLISGIAAALAELKPDAQVIGVEPEGAASMSRSLEAGELVTLEHVDTLADGLKPVRPGALTFAHVRSQVSEVVRVDDTAIRRATVWCAREARLVVEPSGAASVAAWRTLDPGDAQRPTVVVLSGGNFDPSTLGVWAAEEGGEVRETG